MPNQSRNYARRETEGIRDNGAAIREKGIDTTNRRKAGRPVGSKNKPKGLVPTELAREMLGIVKEILPPEHYQEMRKSILEGKHISTLQEAKITLKLMGPPIWKALMEEKKPRAKTALDPEIASEIGETNEAEGPNFGRPLNERMKIYLSLLQFVDKVEERQDALRSDEKKPNITILASRGIDAGRIRSLAEVIHPNVGRDTDFAGRQALGSGTIPDQVSQRPVNISDSLQGETTRVEPDVVFRNGASGGNTHIV